MQGNKHHYIPVFYLKQWAGADSRLCEYSKPYDVLKPHRRHPEQTGYEYGLYALTTYPAPVSEIVERSLMWQIDDSASRALRTLADGHLNSLDEIARLSWARFIISLMRRTPEVARDIGGKLNTALIEADRTNPISGTPDDELTRLARVERQRALLLQSTINNEQNVTRLASMRWAVVTLTNHVPFLTSDRPYVMTNGIGYPNSHVALPISPTQCFVAAATVEEMERLQTVSYENIVGEMNNRMALQARKFVYGVDDKQLEFIAARFGAKLLAGPGDV